ncbi:putative phage exonuclease [Azorhizobium caulinodans ORS 571]|uniref:Putative phage exonuclease n=1 Tax=Azorhizobium caulinodans (strain ATCC 43989 / DSM 5975 / JCM 20966 / LMG 6465 / NBRC 14845 / NCIMB 13405 / ORS 571) TaxID=438753 RepID=A8IF90_AZOC5|nr:phage exonuclease [Azorhizobium caulinodans]BAF89590.1 putative phage exonuclease [Azorhizobium caulinodans ORS 571]
MRTLLIDADVVAYNAAFACEKATEWEPGYWTWHVEWDEVVQAFDAEVSRMMDTLDAGAFRLCLTDSEGNFRRGVDPSYKGTRSSIRKPIILKRFKDFLVQERGAYWRPGLEGDDCMGILATHPKLIPGEKVIVSIDKDMKTVPGLFIRWGAEGASLTEVSEEEADYWHLYQTLTGDVTDGYKGCPGVGPKKAEAILKEPAWRSVVAAYEKAGLDEDDAVIQARLARILRASDYDFKAKRPILWVPPD